MDTNNRWPPAPGRVHSRLRLALTLSVTTAMYAKRRVCHSMFMFRQCLWTAVLFIYFILPTSLECSVLLSRIAFTMLNSDHKNLHFVRTLPIRNLLTYFQHYIGRAKTFRLLSYCTSHRASLKVSPQNAL